MKDYKHTPYQSRYRIKAIDGITKIVLYSIAAFTIIELIRLYTGA